MTQQLNVSIDNLKDYAEEFIDPASKVSTPALDLAVYEKCGRWYFSTKAGIDMGPYANAKLAKASYKRFISRLKEQHVPDFEALVAENYLSAIKG